MVQVVFTVLGLIAGYLLGRQVAKDTPRFISRKGIDHLGDFGGLDIYDDRVVVYDNHESIADEKHEFEE